MSASISTTGQLREFLSNMLIGVKDGKISTDQASRMVKIAQQITESFYSEVKVKQVHLQAGESIHALGALPVNT